MIEDKLSPDERIRLECIAQANSGMTMRQHVTTKDIIERAQAFERFIRDGKTPQGFTVRNN